jgi:hypothetical protein
MKTEASNFPQGEGMTHLSPGPLGGSEEEPKPYVLLTRRLDPPDENEERETVYELYTGIYQNEDAEMRAIWLDEVVGVLEAEIARLREDVPF